MAKRTELPSYERPQGEELKFYPEHPSGAKTRQIETTAMPVLRQDTPFDVKVLCDEFAADADSFFAKYVDKRFEVTGVAKKIGPDIHHKPSIEISDSADGQTYVTGATLRLSAPPYPDYEGSLLCNGDVTISGGNIAAVGCMGVNVYWDKQPVLWFSHVKELPKGTVLSIRDGSGKVLLELTTRNDAVQSAYTSSEFKVGETYSLYIDDEKKLDVTLKDGMNAIGDDGGKFTGGYSRGNMSSFN